MHHLPYYYTNFKDLFAESTAQHSSMVFMESPAETIRYAEYRHRVLCACTMLDSLREQYAVIDTADPIGFTVLYMATVLTGHIACLIPHGQCPVCLPENVVFLGDDILADAQNAVPASLDALPTLDPELPCMVAFSAGTTSDSKGVVLSQKNILCNTEYCMQRYTYRLGQRLVHILPYWHLFGLVADFLAPLHAGGYIYMSSAEFFLSDMRRVKPHCVNIPPVVAGILADALKSVGESSLVTGGQLHKILCAGAALEPEISNTLIRYGIRPCVAYGMTECAPCIAITDENDIVPGTVGKPIDCLQISIAENGEILVWGDTVMLCYLNDPAATETRLRDGVLHTGDLGYFDSRGNLVIQGRNDLMLVFSDAKKCQPEAVEARIASLPEVEECLLSASGTGASTYPRLIVVSQAKKPSSYDRILKILQDAGVENCRIEITPNRLLRNALGKVIRKS